eukprot:6883619-Alexandrium_andersonii.AAC.1
MRPPCVPDTCKPCTRPWALTQPCLTPGWWTLPGGRPSAGRAPSCPPFPTRCARPTPQRAPRPGTVGGGR